MLATSTEQCQMLIILMAKDVGNVNIQSCKSFMIFNQETDFGTKKTFIIIFGNSFW